MELLYKLRDDCSVFCLEYYQVVFAMLGKSCHPWQHHSWYLSLQNKTSVVKSVFLVVAFTMILHKHTSLG